MKTAFGGQSPALMHVGSNGSINVEMFNQLFADNVSALDGLCIG
ncbi:hypothetical protein [Hoeflea sp.]|nr:hypothetical protein [Hoeflea sp.]